MWLRRQDELNEARPTERFSTAIRLLSGRAGMERRYAKDLRARSADEGEYDAHDPDAVTDSVDVRAFAVSQTRREEPVPEPAPEPAVDPEEPTVRVRGARQEPPAERAERAERAVRAPQRAQKARAAQAAAARARRSKVLARRRRTTTLLFLAFTLGAIVAAVG